MLQKIIVSTLIAISLVGIIGIPMGDPKFLANAIGLELAFVALTIISIKKLKFAIIPSIIISCIVIVGNTISPQHVEIMGNLNPLGNAVVLIIGGYVLQGILLVASVFTLKNEKMKKS